LPGLRADKMNVPETSRIRLIPLSKEEVEMYLLADFSFEKHFGLTLHPRSVPENVQKALRERVLARIESDPENHLFYTLWVTIDKTINTVVAGIVFKGPPNENGEAELGAGTLDGFMNRGYMTETTKLLCEWALKNGVGKIVANCSPENVASQRTLEKCGFRVVTKTAENWSWEFQPQ
jgi:[ribosomal protein S5]-alanine N-acetyltransferase